MPTRLVQCKRSYLTLAIALSAALAGCGNDSPDANEGEEHDPDVKLASAGIATPGFRPVAPCFYESDYVSRAVVSFMGDGRYTPRCLRLASGGTVVFQGMFAQHPLEPRPIETMPSPILPTNSGGQVEFEFPDHGFFPYRDAAHPEEIGVIWANYY